MSSGANYRARKLTEKAAALQEEKEQKEKMKRKKKKPSNKQAAEASSSDSSDKEPRRQVKRCHPQSVPELVEIDGDSSDNEPEIVKIGYKTTEEEADDNNGNEELEVQLMEANVSNITACMKTTQTHLQS